MRKYIITLLLAIGLVIPAASFAEAIKIRPNAPERYTIKKGDTLWKISSKYLYRPWEWPKLWGWNKEQIKNPNRIYPGQILRLTWIDGQPKLGIENQNTIAAYDGFTPRAQVEAEGEPIRTLPIEQLKTFIERPRIISKEEFKRAPRIILGPESRVVISPGDRVYAVGIKEPGTYLAYRANTEIKDPDTGEFLGFEIAYGGDLVTQKINDDVQALVVSKSKEEIIIGDRLFKQKSFEIADFVPHAVDKEITGKVLSTYKSVAESGPTYTIALNLGSKDGIEPGHVLSAYKRGKSILIDRSEYPLDNVFVSSEKEKVSQPEKKAPLPKDKVKVSIPAEEIGIMIVYSVYDNLSYALILNSTTNINIGDIISNPNQDMESFN